jgi:hypothetical protein
MPGVKSELLVEADRAFEFGKNGRGADQQRQAANDRRDAAFGRATR